jgi:hypothetical protein
MTPPDEQKPSPPGEGDDGDSDWEAPSRQSRAERSGGAVDPDSIDPSAEDAEDHPLSDVAFTEWAVHNVQKTLIGFSLILGIFALFGSFILLTAGSNTSGTTETVSMSNNTASTSSQSDEESSTEQSTDETTSTSANESTGGSSVVSWRQAGQYVGQNKTVTGEISGIFKTDNIKVLNFSSRPGGFTAVVFSDNFQQFPGDFSQAYEGKSVRVSGEIQTYEGDPQIVMNSPDQITVTD